VGLRVREQLALQRLRRSLGGATRRISPRLVDWCRSHWP
jgi:hypothetical protein